MKSFRYEAVAAPLLMLCLLTAYWLLSTYFSLAGEFTPHDATRIFPGTCLVLVAEAAAALTVYILARSKAVFCVAVAAFLVFNAYSLQLLLSESFQDLGDWTIALVLAVAFFIAFTVANMVVESRALRWLILTGCAILVFVPPVNAALSSSETITVGDANTTASPNIGKVRFATKPNVYLIGFESSGAAPTLKKYMNLDDPAVPAQLKTEGFRTFPNLFSEGAPTKVSFNGLLALDAAYADEVAGYEERQFSGEVPSPLLQIFAANGYETTTLYKNGYLGRRKGSFVDHYRTYSSFSVCTFMEAREKRWSLFGLCRLQGTRLWRVRKDLTWQNPKQFEFLLDTMKAMSARAKPQLLVAHIQPPLHVDKSHYEDNRAERERFKKRYERSERIAAGNLHKLVEFIRKSDPGAILFTFGDHGPYLSRKADWGNPKDRPFIVSDRYAIAGGVYPANVCAPTFDNPVTRNYTTTVQVARMIIKCLSGGADAFKADYRHTMAIDRSARFEDFLYE